MARRCVCVSVEVVGREGQARNEGLRVFTMKTQGEQRPCVPSYPPRPSPFLPASLHLPSLPPPSPPSPAPPGAAVSAWGGLEECWARTALVGD